MNANGRLPRVLSIAGSDSGGGAGIQADLKAFAACGVHGMTAITAITAQNTVGVSGVHHVPAEMIIAQVAAVAQDIGVDAVKIGMLGTVETIEAVRFALDEVLGVGAADLEGGPARIPVVLDPVMVSESGAVLLELEAREALVEQLLPRATVLTPNLPEARTIAAGGKGGAVVAQPPPADERAEVLALAECMYALGPAAVVLTGGHRERASDLFFDGERVVELPGERFADGAAHGSGCTHSSVLAARLAWGDDPLAAARIAKELASRAVADGLRELGAGAGPVDLLGIRVRFST